MPDLVKVLKSALSLDVHVRAPLAERLLASLEELSEEEADRPWPEEAQRGVAEHPHGPPQPIPARTRRAAGNSAGPA